MIDKVYTVEDLSQLLGVCKKTVLNYLRCGQLKGVKIGNRWKVSEDYLNEFLRTGTQPDYYEKLKGNKPLKISTSKKEG